MIYNVIALIQTATTSSLALMRCYPQHGCTGSIGAVGSTYNHFAKLYNAIADSVESGDTAKTQELQNLSVNIILRFKNLGLPQHPKRRWHF